MEKALLNIYSNLYVTGQVFSERRGAYMMYVKGKTIIFYGEYRKLVLFV
jgi:hypothetical protein